MAGFAPVPTRVDFVDLEHASSAGGTSTAYRRSTSSATSTPPSAGRSSTGRSPPTTRWASTTPGAAPTRTSTSATTPCSASEQRYQNGFDCQGLWVEVEVEKELGFNVEARHRGVRHRPSSSRRCKERVGKFAAIQTEQSIRLGYWMDWDNSLLHMSDENNYTIWRFLKKCHERGWSTGPRRHALVPALRAPASPNMEIVTEGYQELTHTQRLSSSSRCSTGHGEKLLVWTTTPWTLTATSPRPSTPS